MKDIRKKVNELIEKYDCCSVWEMCERMGITVLEKELPRSINGFTVTMEGLPFIVLNAMLPDADKRVTAAHELGHIVLHKSTNTVALSVNTSFCINKYEREADCFAAHLLIAFELAELEGMESVTSETVSKLTSIPRETIENAFFGEEYC